MSKPKQKAVEYTNWRSHACSIRNRVSNLIQKKYDAGQAEHGGNLWRKAMMPHLTAEIIDLQIYFDVLKQQHEAAIEALDEVCESKDSVNLAELITALFTARNLLKYGNPQGQEEEELNPDTWDTPPVEEHYEEADEFRQRLAARAARRDLMNGFYRYSLGGRNS